MHDLIDTHMVRHDAPGYANPQVSPGDRILEIDGRSAEHLTMEALHDMLSGELHSSVKILLKGPTGLVYEIVVLRHHFHALLSDQC